MRLAIGPALVLCALLAGNAAFAATAPAVDDTSRLIEVQHGDTWTLVGEWTRERSDEVIPGALYTLGIIALGDEHYRVLSGTIVTGCCYWPAVSRLDTLSPGTFFDPAFAARYVVADGGTLSVHRQGEPVQVLPPTPHAERFSRRWFVPEDRVPMWEWRAVMDVLRPIYAGFGLADGAEADWEVVRAGFVDGAQFVPARAPGETPRSLDIDALIAERQSAPRARSSIAPDSGRSLPWQCFD